MLAWQRMGLPPDIAYYIASCDNQNQNFPRTPYYICSGSKHPNLAFQGCSSASLSYLVVEDIILATFQSSLHIIDPYLARDPHGTLFPQTPTQFVDDTYVFCKSPQGAQSAIDLLQAAEPLLNIRINPLPKLGTSPYTGPPHHIQPIPLLYSNQSHSPTSRTLTRRDENPHIPNTPGHPHQGPRSIHFAQPFHRTHQQRPIPNQTDQKHDGHEKSIAGHHMGGITYLHISQTHVHS